jgi:hypothetical protein
LPKGGTKSTSNKVFGLALALTFLTQPALAVTILNCSTKKVTITYGRHGETSSTRSENLSFRVDEAAKTVRFVDNTPLIVTRFDKNRISAQYNDVFFEFDRQDGTLSYASSSTKADITTVIAGSGQCAAVKRRSS